MRNQVITTLSIFFALTGCTAATGAGLNLEENDPDAHHYYGSYAAVDGTEVRFEIDGFAMRFAVDGEPAVESWDGEFFVFGIDVRTEDPELIGSSEDPAVFAAADAARALILELDDPAIETMLYVIASMSEGGPMEEASFAAPDPYPTSSEPSGGNCVLECHDEAVECHRVCSSVTPVERRVACHAGCGAEQIGCWTNRCGLGLLEILQLLK